MREKVNGYLGFVFVLLLQLSIFAFGYGRLTERVDQIILRLDRLERSVDAK